MSSETKLKPELVPKPLWRHSAYHLLGRGSDWKRIRLDALKSCGCTCEICGLESASGRGLNCHEVWDYDDDTRTATLVKLRIQCSACDTATHMGLSIKNGFKDAAIRQLCKVNDMTSKEALGLYKAEHAVWRERSLKQWRVTVRKSLVQRYPELAVVEEREIQSKPSV